MAKKTGVLKTDKAQAKAQAASKSVAEAATAQPATATAVNPDARILSRLARRTRGGKAPHGGSATVIFRTARRLANSSPSIPSGTPPSRGA
jgi:hypothetical protein